MVDQVQNDTVTCGNFHGEYPAKALDYLAIGVHEIGNMGERRIERLCNPACSELPAFLTMQGNKLFKLLSRFIIHFAIQVV